MRPGPLDFYYLVLVFALPITVEVRGTVRRLKAKIAAGVPGARIQSYRRTILLQIGLSLPVVIGWIVAKRPWRALFIVAPTSGARLWVCLGLIAMAVSFGLMQLRGIGQIAANSEERQRYRGKLESLSFMLPRSRREFRWFTALSITAGTCEEFLYRGYVMWAFLIYMSLPLAVIASAVLFALGHLYQGRRGALKTGLVAIVMNIIVWAGGWLVPAMLVHALLDATTGGLAFLAFQDEASESAIDPSLGARGGSRDGGLR